MNPTTSVRRSDQPLQIGGRHGYRIEGDTATINAEISVPPYHPGGAWALELWAAEQAYQGGSLSGVKVGELRFELPTPLAPHTHRVEAQVAARLPLQGHTHAMLLALVEEGTGRVHDVANFPQPETFPAPHLEGDVGYEIRGCEVVLYAAAVVNPRTTGNLSGTLSLELWALSLDADTSSDAAPGHCLALAQLAPIAGGDAATSLQCRAAFIEPPPGRFQLVLRLREWTQAVGYATRDQRSFALQYEVAAEVAAQPVAEFAAEPVAEFAAEPVAEIEVQPVAELAAEPVAEIEVQPVAELAAEPVAEVEVQPIAELAAEPVAAPATELEVAVAAPALVPSLSTALAEALPEPEGWEVSVAEAPVVQEVTSPAVSPRSPRVSIQTGSLEELARVKGLNAKIAKEIIKARPFSAVEELVKVRGIGRKSLDKLRMLVTL